MKMYAEILFDREIDKEKHYISPGGYEVRLKNGKTVAFDFMDYEGIISESDRRILKCNMRNLDVEAFPDSRTLKPQDIQEFTEFFVFTGEDSEPEIHPVKILSLAMGDGPEYFTFLGKFTEKIFVTDGSMAMAS